MKITLACIGFLKSSPELALYQQYAERLTWPLTLKEYQVKKNLSGQPLKKEEAAFLLKDSSERRYVGSIWDECRMTP